MSAGLTSGLDKLLCAIGRAPLVVVSDRYPPRSHGGAEVSLHIQLRALGLVEQVLVVTFDDNATRASLDVVDGVRVLQLPRQGAWPSHRSPMAWPRPGWRALELPSRARHWLARNAESPRVSEADGELLRRVASARAKGGPVGDFVEFPEGLGAVLVSRVLRALQPSIVHADNHRSIGIVSEAARGLRIKRVAVVRDNRFHCVRHDQSVRVGESNCVRCGFECAAADLPEQPEIQRALLKRVTEYRRQALAVMDRVVVTSRYLEGALSAVVDSNVIVRIPNAADDLQIVDPLMSGIPELPGTNVLVVGMLTENKGQLELARCLDLLVSLVPDLVLHFAGRGARLEKRIRQLCADIGVSSRVVWHGYVDRPALYRLYRQCQIVALPALWPEPFGRVPLESGLAYRPVVSFALGGLTESIVDGETGFLVSPGDMRGFANGIARLANDGVLRRSMGNAARRHITTNFRVETTCALLENLWQSLAS